MTLIDAIILGALQGITEFLPISSSGHLVLGQALLGIEIPGNAFEVVTHLGTLLSVFCVFWKDIFSLITSINQKESQKYILYILMGTLPAVIFGLSAKTTIANIFDSVQLVSGALIFTGLVLFFSKRLKSGSKPISLKSGIIIGLAQAVAIIPGISRSGMTITTAMALGTSGKGAAKFSFLLAIPAISGAGLLTALDTSFSGISISSISLFAAFLSAFIVGYVSLKWLLGMLESGRFHLFGYYCIFVGLMTMIAM